MAERKCAFPDCKQTLSKSAKYFCGQDHFKSAKLVLGPLYSPQLGLDEMRKLIVQARKEEKSKKLTAMQKLSGELAKARERANFAETAYERVRKGVLTQSQFVEKFSGAFAAAKPPPVQKIVLPSAARGREPQNAVLKMSDLHIGECDETFETHAPGYDWQVFCGELEILKHKLVRIISHHRLISPVPKLTMFWEGDFVCGHEVFPGQSWRSEDHVVIQVVDAIAKLAGFTNDLSGIFDEIEIVAVPGNHGAVRGKQPGFVHMNYDFLVYHMVRTMLRNNPRVKFHITPSWWTIHKICGWNFYIDHGATFGVRWMGIPWYGIKRAEGRTRKMLDSMREMMKSSLRTFDRRNPAMREVLKECAPHLLQEDLRFDYLSLAHHHEDFHWAGIIGNGCFARGNYYAMRRFQSVSIPTQLLFGVHPKVGATWFYPLRLDIEE